MIPDSSVLHGTSYKKAKCCGMPHFMARYTSGDIKHYKRKHDAICMICGRPATETHHEPPGRLYFDLRTKWGIFMLRPALITLCHECHELRTNNRLSISWEWNDEETEELWWSGYLLAHGYPAHSPRLYDLGGWHVEKQG